MMEIKQGFPYHLVLVRHGESEGDVRRETLRNGDEYSTDKAPREEEQTELGHRQSVAAGKWITQYVLEEYSIDRFDLCAVSPLVRTRQSADSLGFSDNWQPDPLLTERNRGKIQGLTPSEHQRLYPESFQQMKNHPFHWVPPEGESILKVAYRAQRFFEKTHSEGHRAILVEAHRDWIWAAQVPLDHISLQQAESIDTDIIRNAQTLHYTNVDPASGQVGDNSVIWKRSVCPWQDEDRVKNDTNSWQSVATSSHDENSDFSFDIAA